VKKITTNRYAALVSMKHLFNFLFLLFGLSAWAQEDLNPAAPIRKPNLTEDVVPLPNSVVHLPLIFKFTALEKSINSLYNGVLYEDTSFNDNGVDNVKIRVKKIAPITLKPYGDSLGITCPIHINLIYRYQNNSLSETFSTDMLAISATKAADFYMDVVLGTKLFIGGEWTVKTKTTGSYKWRKPPFIEIAGIQIPVEKLIHGQIQTQINDVAKMIDETFVKEYPIKDMMTKFWYQIQNPYKVDDSLNLWLNLSPQTVSYVHPFVKGAQLESGIKITAKVDASVGQFSGKRAITTLPSLKRMAKPASGLEIWLKSGATYNEITRLSKSMLVDSVYKDDESKSEITIKDVAVYGNRDVLEFKIQVDGFTKKLLVKKNIKGTVYLRATPVLDSVTQVVKLTQVDYDLNSKDIFLKATSAVLANTVKKAVEKNVVVDLKPYLKDAKTSINSTLKQFDTEYIRFNGQVSNINVNKIYLTDEGIRFLIFLKGNLQGSYR
jgi:hypothetical protein